MPKFQSVFGVRILAEFAQNTRQNIRNPRRPKRIKLTMVRCGGANILALFPLKNKN